MANWGRFRTLVKDAAEYSTQTPNTLRVDFVMIGEGRALRIAARLRLIARWKSLSSTVSRDSTPILCFPYNKIRIPCWPRGREKRMNFWVSEFWYWLYPDL